MIPMKEIVEAIEFLPAFNQTAQKALSLIRSDEYNSKMISEVIKLDAGLSANILKSVNSAYYAKNKEIHDIQTAVSYLGKDYLFSLLNLISTRDYYSSKLLGYELKTGELWEHNLSVAIFAEALSYLEPTVDKNLLFSSGLLHDIGKIVLNIWVEREWSKIIELVENEELDFISAEKRVLGYNHCMIGSAILKKWGFPEAIILGAKHHHDAHLFDNPVVRLICLADYLTYVVGYMSQRDNMRIKGYDQVLEYYKIKTKDIDVMISNSFDMISNMINEFKIS